MRKSNPIIYTFDGKIIGGREQFVQSATKYFGLDEEQLIIEDLTSKVFSFLFSGQYQIGRRRGQTEEDSKVGNQDFAIKDSRKIQIVTGKRSDEILTKREIDVHGEWHRLHSS